MLEKNRDRGGVEKPFFKGDILLDRFFRNDIVSNR
jgi:hypothetical protein